MSRAKNIPGKCSVEDCQNPSQWKGLCGKHYKRQWRLGNIPLNTKNRLERQRLVVDWAKACFGAPQVNSLPQRGLRLCEEAIEAAQAAGCNKQMLHDLVDYVYGRPVGKLFQEIGGVAVCAFVLADAGGFYAEDAETAEISRILSKPKEEFSKRNDDKNKAGFLA